MADFANQPVDYASLIGQGQNLAGNPVAQQQANVNLQNSQIAGRQVQQQMAMQRYALQRQQMFGSDLGNYVKNPTASGLATLFGKYPEYEQQAAAARGALDRGDITELGSAAALAAKGQYGEAAKVIQGRIDAETAAGTDPAKIAQSKHVLDLLNSNDPQQQKGALGLLSLGVGVAVGPEKAAEFLKANGLSSEPIDVAMDHRLVTASGQPIVGASPKLESVTTTNPDGSSTAHAFNPYSGKFGAGAVDGSAAPPTQAEGGGPASGGGAAAGGMQASVAHVLGNEGGLNPSDMNGSPTNFGINYSANKPELAKLGITSPGQMGNLTKDQAAQIYATKYWPQSGAEKLPTNLQAPYFDVYVRSPALAKRILAQSGGDPAQFAQLAAAAFQKMAANNPKAAPYTHAWAARDAGNAAIAAGQVPNAVPTAGSGQAVPANPYEVGGAPTASLNTKGADTGLAWNPSHTAEAPIPGGPEDPKIYSPAMIDDMTGQYALTGQMQGLSGGMGGGGMGALKKVIAKHLPQWLADRGMSAADLPVLRTRYTADNKALSAITSTVTSLQASEQALRNQAQLVIEKQKPLIQLGIISDNAQPWRNSGSIEANWHLASGDQGTKVRQAIKGYRDALNAYATSYSKFMSSGNGVGGSAAPSDSARALAAELNDEGMGPSTLKTHMDTSISEAQRHVAGFAQQQSAIQQRIGSYLKPHQQQQGDLPPGAKVIGTLNGKRVIEVNGQRMVEQ